MIFSGNITFSSEIYDSKTLLLAQQELQSLINKRFDNSSIGSHTTNIVFELKPHLSGYAVSVADNNLQFTAPSDIEILYAVYDFAEQYLDFCFFEPGIDRLNNHSNSTELPEGTLIEETTPRLKRRGFIQEFPTSDDNYIIADWMAKNRLNYLLTWMKYYDLMPAEMKEYYQVRGIEIESGHHNFDYWIPLEKYAEKHPDFFAIVNGERVKFNKNDKALLLSKQLCTTNPDLRRAIVKNMVEYCRENPDIKTISLIPNDGFGWCECDTCSTFYDKNNKGELYSLSEHVYKADRIYHDMVADISQQLKDALPDISITFCAYVNYCSPSEDFKLNKGMAVHFAPYWRCINHRINDPECATNSQYAADLKRWINAKQGGAVNIYEYYMGVNLYVSLPMIHHEDIFDEMAYYNQEGVDGVLTQFHLPHWSVYGLNYYLMAKAAYSGDKKQTVQAALERIFGNNAQQADEFYPAMKKLTLSTGNCHIPYPYSLLSRTSIEQYTHIHSLATELATSQPEDKFQQDLVVWTDYLHRFKTLFDRYHAKTVNIAEIEDFRNWVHQQKDSKVFVHAKVDMLLGAWLSAIEDGKQWYHFNLDWEDNYIKKHESTLQ